MSVTNRGIRATRSPDLLRRLGSGALKVVGKLATPLVPDDYLDLINPLRAGADLRAKIISRVALTERTAQLTLRPGGAWRGHIPGQYVRLGVDIAGVRRWRAYSVTSAHPGLTITVTELDGGLVSNHLVHGDVLGTIVALDQATGAFTCPTPAPQKILLITGGSGLTPILGKIRSGIYDRSEVTLLHSVRRRADLFAAGDLARFATRDGNRVQIRYTNDEGQLNLAALDALVPDWRERQVWACGPTGLLDDCEAHWRDTGLAENLHVERFRPTIAAVGAGGAATFAASGVTVTASGASALLDVGEDAGVLMPSGCRMGICFGCIAPLTAGSVKDLRNGEVTTAGDGEKISIQTCISAAAGPCTIDL